MTTPLTFTGEVLHPFVGGFVSSVVGANTSTAAPASINAPGRTRSKRNKFQKLTPEQESSFLGTGTVPLQRYEPHPPNQRDKALAWSSTIQERLDHQGAANRVSNAYFTMRDIYSAANPSDLACAGMPAAMAVIYIPSLGTSFYASVIRGQQAGVTGPMSNLHPALTNAVAGQRHRTDFACAEMHALNSMLHALLGQVPADAAARIFGTPDGEDSGRNGAKKYMAPCQNSASGVGCTAVLTALGVGFLKTG